MREKNKPKKLKTVADLKNIGQDYRYDANDKSRVTEPKSS